MSAAIGQDDAARQVAPASAPRLTVANDYLHAAYRRDSLVIVLLPAIGALGAAIWGFAFGVTALNLVLVVAMYAITVGGIDIGYHRYFAHRAFRAHPAVRVALAVTGSMAAQGRVLRWVANHRRHHAYSDRAEDPHSPIASREHPDGHHSAWAGLWHAHVAWIFSHEPSNAIYFAKDIIRDPVLAFINRWYLAWIVLGMAIPAAVGRAATGHALGLLEGVLWGWALPVFLSQNAAFFVNSIGHYMGSRPFDTKDNSRNVAWFAVPSIGGSYQNNHHAFPSAATTRIEWWELDIGAWVIRALAFVGLVWDLKAPSPEQILAARRPAR